MRARTFRPRATSWEDLINEEFKGFDFEQFGYRRSGKNTGNPTSSSKRNTTWEDLIDKEFEDFDFDTYAEDIGAARW